MTVEPAGRDEFIALMTETYGSSMSENEFRWWFDDNPAGPRLLSAARENAGLLGVLAMSFFRFALGGEERLVAFAVHAATAPAARGRGVFSKLELENEQEAARAGAVLALGFTNPVAGPILVGKLGWQETCRLRVWARPLRLLRRGRGALLVDQERRPFEHGHEEIYRAEASGWTNHIVRTARYLNWRYIDSPRRYARIEGERGWAVVGHTTWGGWSAGIVADVVGSGKAALLRRCANAVDADLLLGLPNPGERRSFLAAGFVPTPRTIRFIGKPLRADVPLPRGRKSWRFSLGDLDFV